MMVTFTLLLANQQQRVMKRPKMDVLNRSRSAFDPYSGAIDIVRMAQSPQMRWRWYWRRSERPMELHNYVEQSTVPVAADVVFSLLHELDGANWSSGSSPSTALHGAVVCGIVRTRGKRNRSGLDHQLLRLGICPV